MTGEAKPKKHTAKEITAKVAAVLTNRGGGKTGLADRIGQEKGGHTKLKCPLCKVTTHDIKSMQIHHEARHPKIPLRSPKSIDEITKLAPNLTVLGCRSFTGVKVQHKIHPLQVESGWFILRLLLVGAIVSVF